MSISAQILTNYHKLSGFTQHAFLIVSVGWGFEHGWIYHVVQIMGVRSHHLCHILWIRSKSQVQPTLMGGGRMWREHQEVGITVESARHGRQWQPEST